MSDFERSSPPPASGAAVFLQVGLGIVLVFVLHALAALAIFGLFFLADKLALGQEVTLWILALAGLWAFGIGLVQLVYVLPAALAASFVRRGIALGMLIGAALTFVLQGACYGLYAGLVGAVSLAG